jgi:hypothetical protein
MDGMKSDVVFEEVKNGWFAISHRPRLAGFGLTRDDALRDLEWALETFQRSLASYSAISPTGLYAP